MGDKTRIAWADATWNPVVGCTAVSKGCENCYAARWAHSRMKGVEKYKDLTNDFGKWNGQVRFVMEEVDRPYRWTKPRVIFIPSMGDLFHYRVMTAQIDLVFNTIKNTPMHTYIMLTKRIYRMRDYLWSYENRHGVLPNLWAGTSAEDQYTYNTRVKAVMEMPVEVSVISFEPLLGPIQMGQDDWFHWAIVGAESGPGHRRMDLNWARGIRDQAKDRAMAFFMKQVSVEDVAIPEDLDIREWPKKVGGTKK